MATSKKFSELPAASSVGNGDLFAIAHEDALAETGYVSQKLTAAQAGQKVNGDTEYPTSLPSFPENGQNPFAALEKLNSDIIGLYPVNIASGSIANFTTSLELPLVAMSAEIVAQQASGTPTPSSPLPISGVSSIKLVQTSGSSNLATALKGLFLGTYDFVDLGSLTWTNGTGGATRFVATRSSALPKAQGNIICDILETTTNTAIYNGTVDDAIAIHTNNALWARDTSYSTPTDFTTAMNGHYAIYELDTPQTPTITAEQFATLCTAFGITGNTFTIALGQTVHDGSVDAINGKATKTVKYFSFSEAQYYGTYGTDNANLYYVEIPDYATDKIKQMSSSSFDGILISNMMSKISDSSSRMKDNEIRTNAGANINTFYFRADEFADLTALNAFLAVTPLQVVAELQTPVEITGLTPDNFTTIAGEQNIFSDCGEVSVGFKQGIQEYIDAQIAATQALIL